MTYKITDKRREYLDNAIKELALREQLHELQRKRWLPAGYHFIFDKEPTISEQEFQEEATRLAEYRVKLDIELDKLTQMELLHALLETLDAKQRDVLFRLATVKEGTYFIEGFDQPDFAVDNDDEDTDLSDHCSFSLIKLLHDIREQEDNDKSKVR